MLTTRTLEEIWHILEFILILIHLIVLSLVAIGYSSGSWDNACLVPYMRIYPNVNLRDACYSVTLFGLAISLNYNYGGYSPG
jgi:hypothetical protein